MKRSDLGCHYGVQGRLAILEGPDLLLVYAPGQDTAAVGARTSEACDGLPLYLRRAVRFGSAPRPPEGGR
jgi:hypothetical protein